MSPEILVEANEAWGYFADNKKELSEMMHEIASNCEFGVTVFITEQDGFPYILVLSDEVVIFEEGAENAEDCEAILKSVYDDFLTGNAVTKISSIIDDDNDNDKKQEEEDQRFEIDMRDMEIEDAIWDLLTVILDGAEEGEEKEANASYIKNDIIEDCKEHFLEYIYLKFGIQIRRPMIIEYDDGTEEYQEFPYDYLELENTDSPIYKS